MNNRQLSESHCLNEESKQEKRRQLEEIFSDARKEWKREKTEQLGEMFCGLWGELENRETAQRALDEVICENMRKDRTARAIGSLAEMTEKTHRKYGLLKEQYEQQFEENRREQISDMLEAMVDNIQEKEDEYAWRRYRRKTTKRLKMVLAIMTAVALLMSIGFAWYSRVVKHAVTEPLRIMTPYTLYLLEGNASDTLRLTVGDLHPGETKQIVVCVSSCRPGEDAISKAGVFPYSLELVYTENIQLQYHLYELSVSDQAAYNAAVDKSYFVTARFTEKSGDTEVLNTYYFKKTVGKELQTDTDISGKNNLAMYAPEQTEESALTGIVNLGQYDIYSKKSDENGATGDSFTLSLSEPEKQNNYFLIEITLDAGIDLDQFAKETDLIYLVAKAGVPKPVEMEAGQ